MASAFEIGSYVIYYIDNLKLVDPNICYDVGYWRFFNSDSTLMDKWFYSNSNALTFCPTKTENGQKISISVGCP